MKIVPMKGIIPGNGVVDIDIHYTATTNTTIISEVEVKNWVMIDFYLNKVFFI